MGGTESKARSKTGDPLVAIMQGYKFDRSKGTDFKVVLTDRSDGIAL